MPCTYVICVERLCRLVLVQLETRCAASYADFQGTRAGTDRPTFPTFVAGREFPAPIRFAPRTLRDTICDEERSVAKVCSERLQDPRLLFQNRARRFDRNLACVRCAILAIEESARLRADVLSSFNFLLLLLRLFFVFVLSSALSRLCRRSRRLLLFRSRSRSRYLNCPSTEIFCANRKFMNQALSGSR